MVQSPASAKFDGMPQSALSTGLIDIVGTPQELAEQCLYITNSHQNLITVSEQEESFFSAEELNYIIHTLLIKTGIDFQYYKKGTIERRLIKRIQIKGFENLNDYRDYLTTSSEEPHLLTKEFLIGVTQFFRNIESFNYLEKEIIHRYFKIAEQMKSEPGVSVALQVKKPTL